MMNQCHGEMGEGRDILCFLEEKIPLNYIRNTPKYQKWKTFL